MGSMTSTDQALHDAHQLARRLFRLTEGVRDGFERTVAGFGLTPVQARAVLFLEQPVPMRDLAGHLACDASNVTGVADRLGARGLVERVAGPDRRVRLLQLTQEGIDLRAELARAVADAPTPVDRLTDRERAQLLALLDKMVGEDPAG